MILWLATEVAGKSLSILGLEFGDHTCCKRKLAVYFDSVSQNSFKTGD